MQSQGSDHSDPNSQGQSGSQSAHDPSQPDAYAQDSSPPASSQPASGDTLVIPTSTTGVQVPDDASDADLIEKEWVVKAKDIVMHTQDNPYEQQKAMSKFKADYMKKRYNKDIKTEDASGLE